jgi:hypothetical protein
MLERTLKKESFSLLNRKLQRALKGGLSGQVYVCPGDSAACGYSGIFCNRFCLSNYGVPCVLRDFVCP